MENKYLFHIMKLQILIFVDYPFFDLKLILFYLIECLNNIHKEINSSKIILAIHIIHYFQNNYFKNLNFLFLIFI